MRASQAAVTLLGFITVLRGGSSAAGQAHPPSPATTARVVADTLTYGPFGTVHLYHAQLPPSHTILFVSGDGGWNLGVVDMARAFAGRGALVVGIDIVHYLRAVEGGAGGCGYLAADFEALSQFVQHRLAFPRYQPPILVGYSSGASLVYALVVQAPPNTFRGAVSMGFCPSLTLRRPLCGGEGLRTSRAADGTTALTPASNISLPWIVLHGDQDQVCSLDATRAFVARVRDAELVPLPHVGHGFSVQAHWLPQLKAAVARLSSGPPLDQPAKAATVGDLPLVEVPPVAPARDVFAVVLSGDGGWAGIDRQVARVLADSGIAVVGWNSLQYFWRPRTPEVVAADLARVLRAYAAHWHIERVLLVGYSRGASVLPAVFNRLPDDVRGMVTLVALLAPETHIGFAFHPLDLVHDTRRASDLPVLPELARLRGPRVLCLYGADETDTPCPQLHGDHVLARAFPGGHHLGGHYPALAVQILGALNR